jgi:hypothetical protein
MRRVLLMACLIVLICGLNTGCKNVRETKSPGHASQRSASQVVADDLSAFAKRDVSFDEVPRISVTLDLRQCVGSGRWLDPAKPASPRLGAVSVTITKEAGLAANEAQPDPWLYEPQKSSNAENQGIDGAAAHAWRVPASTYRVDAVAFGIANNTLESKISKRIDLTSIKDLTVAITGKWASSQICELAWQ